MSPIRRPTDRPEAFDRFVQDLVERERVDLVVPVSDVTTHLVARAAMMRFVRHARRRRRRRSRRSRSCRTSGACCSAPPQLGIPIPRTHFVDGLAGLRRSARADRLSSRRQTRAFEDEHRHRLAVGLGAVCPHANRISCVSTGRAEYLTSLSVADSGAHGRSGNRCLRPVRSRPAARRVRAPAPAGEAALGRRQRAVRERRRRSRAVPAGDAAARSARMARRGDDRIQARTAARAHRC